MLNIEATLEVIGKPQPKDWRNEQGQNMKSYRLNVAQNDGVDVATIRCPQNVYDAVKRGDVANFLCTFAEYADRSDFRIIEVKQFLNMKMGTSGTK